MTAECDVYILARDQSARRNLSMILRERNYWVTPFSEAEDLLDAAEFLDPGIALIDLDRPDLNAVELQHSLHDRRQDILTIFMGEGIQPHTAVQLIKSGASDVIDQPFIDRPFIDHARDTLPEALHEALLEAQAQLDEKIVLQARRSAAMRKLSLLSPRELDVLHGVTAGHSNKDMAQLLQLSARTVEMHRANLMRKIGSHNLSQIIQLEQDAQLGARKSY